MTITQVLEDQAEKFFKPALESLGFPDVEVFIAPFDVAPNVPVLSLRLNRMLAKQAIPTIKQQSGTEATAENYFTCEAKIGAFHREDSLWPNETLSKFPVFDKHFNQNLRGSKIQAFGNIEKADLVFEDDDSILYGAIASYSFDALIQYTIRQPGVCPPTDPLARHAPQINVKLGAKVKSIFTKKPGQ